MAETTSFAARRGFARRCGLVPQLSPLPQSLARFKSRNGLKTGGVGLRTMHHWTGDSCAGVGPTSRASSRKAAAEPDAALRETPNEKAPGATTSWSVGPRTFSSFVSLAVVVECRRLPP